MAAAVEPIDCRSKKAGLYIDGGVEPALELSDGSCLMLYDDSSVIMKWDEKWKLKITKQNKCEVHDWLMEPCVQ